MIPPTSNSQHRLSSRNRKQLILLVSVLTIVAVAVVVIILVRPPDYRFELPGNWADGCIGDPEVITDVFSETQFSKASISHDKYSDHSRWYQCSWDWELEGTGGWRQFVDLQIDVLDGDEYDDLDGMIETVRSDSKFTLLTVEEIDGFESGYCTSTVGLDEFDCQAVDSNLKVSLRINGGGNGEIGDSGIAVEDYLAEVGAYVQDQLAR